jgi:TPR repeat protein
MKPHFLASVLLLVFSITHLPAQQAEADRKLFKQTKAKAEKGDADAQLDLGDWYYLGQGGGRV